MPILCHTATEFAQDGYNHFMREVLRITGWCVCIVYASIPSFWLIIHPFAGYWRSQRKSPYRVLLPGWITMWMVLALATFHWNAITLYSNWWSWATAAVFFICGFSLYFQSTRSFTARQVGGVAEVLQNQEQRLVVFGIRSRIRHPMYLGHFCGLLAWSIGTGLAVCYGLTFFAAITGILMTRAEDNELELRFGAPYRTYRQEVPAFLPKI